MNEMPDFIKLRGVFFVQLMLIVAMSSNAVGHWSPELLAETSRLHCFPQELKLDTTFLHGIKSGNFTRLGKVEEMEVCLTLCCELETCDAAFMAQRSCFAVNCYNRNLCVTAPARKNKWKPMVTFVTRTESKTKLKDNNKNTKKIMDNQTNEASGHRKQTDSFGSISSVSPQLNNNVHKNKGLKISQSKNAIEFGNSDQSTNRDGFIIKAEPKKETPEFEELETLSRTRIKAKPQTKSFHDSRYSILSAAVITCLMTFLLSGFAVAAAKMRRNSEEQEQDHLEACDYQPVNTDEN